MPNPEKTAVEQSEIQPELQPVSERYGRDLFDAALRIAAMTAALDYLLGRTKSRPQLVHLYDPIDSIAKGLADLNNDLIAAKGWHLEDVVECIGEIGKALKNGTPRIITPH